MDFNMDEKGFNQYCRNCGHEMPNKAFFCPNCGQRNTDGRVSFRELTAYFLSNLLNLDGSIFQTLGALAIPGKLTNDFFEGKHIRYYHPVRLFILSGALFIALLSIIASKANIEGVDKVWKNREDAYAMKKVFSELDTLSSDIEIELNQPTIAIAFDSLKTRFGRKHLSATEDSVGISDVINFGKSRGQTGKKVALDDLVRMKEEALADKYGVEGFWERQIFLQNIRIQKSLKSFLFYMMGNILWMVLIMMPMLALALKLLYIRHHYLYIEHLIFSFHTHTFLFLFYSLLLLLGMWAGYEILNWAIILVGIYLLLAVKNFYKQKWWKTIVKFILVNILYFTIMFLAMIAVAMVSVFLF